MAEKDPRRHISVVDFCASLFIRILHTAWLFHWGSARIVYGRRVFITISLSHRHVFQVQENARI